MADKLYAFCQSTRNANEKIKDWSIKIKEFAMSLSLDVQILRVECLKNKKEVRKVRCLVVGHAKISLQAIERSFSLALARSGSLKSRRRVDGSPSTSAPPLPDEKIQKKKKTKVPMKDKSNKNDGKKGKKKAVPQRRPQVIVISGSGPGNGANYAKITKKLKDGMDLDALGVKVIEMRRTQHGAITMTVGKEEQGTLEAEKLRVAVRVVLGPDASVQLYPNLTRMEV